MQSMSEKERSQAHHTSVKRVAAVVPTEGTPPVAAAPAAIIGRVPVVAAEIPLEGIRGAAALLSPASVCTGGVVGTGGVAVSPRGEATALAGIADAAAGCRFCACLAACEPRR